MEELKRRVAEGGDAEAEERLKDVAWEKAEKLARGEKVKDDPSLLRKTLKREQKKKEKSRAEWYPRRNRLLSVFEAQV